MAIVAIALAALFWFLSGRLYDPQIRTILRVVAVLALAFAIYLAVFEPAEAWDMRSIGRLMSKLVGAGFRHALH